MKKILVVDAAIERGQPTPILQESNFEVRPYPSFYRMMTPAVKFQPDLIICIVRKELEAKAKNRITFLKDFPKTEHIPVIILFDEPAIHLASQYTLIADLVLPLSIAKSELEQNVRMILEGGIE